MKYHTMDQIIKIADKKLVDITHNLLGDGAEKWFNSKVKGLGYKTPYEYCKNGNQKAVYDLLSRLEDGTFW